MAASDTLRDLADRLNEAAAELALIAEHASGVDAGTASEAAAKSGEISPLMFQLSIFVLACVVGYYVVWSVTAALHTPLMSVTNAISSVIIVGALVAAGADVAGDANWATRIFGFIAVILASVNIFGGFLVTERMLAMYKKKG